MKVGFLYDDDCTAAWNWGDIISNLTIIKSKTNKQKKNNFILFDIQDIDQKKEWQMNFCIKKIKPRLVELLENVAAI